jgi:hypothetical protein
VFHGYSSVLHSLSYSDMWITLFSVVVVVVGGGGGGGVKSHFS